MELQASVNSNCNGNNNNLYCSDFSTWLISAKTRGSFRSTASRAAQEFACSEQASQRAREGGRDHLSLAFFSFLLPIPIPFSFHPTTSTSTLMLLRQRDSTIKSCARCVFEPPLPSYTRFYTSNGVPKYNNFEHTILVQPNKREPLLNFTDTNMNH